MVGAHLVDDILDGKSLPHLGVEVELLDDLLQVGPAGYLLANRVDHLVDALFLVRREFRGVDPLLLIDDRGG